MNKDIIIKFRVTEDEVKELQMKACEYGMSISGYCRYMIFEGKENQRVFYEKVLPRLVYIGVLESGEIDHRTLRILCAVFFIAIHLMVLTDCRALLHPQEALHCRSCHQL